MKRLILLLGLASMATILAGCSSAEPEIAEKEVTRVFRETVIETVRETVVETVIVEGTPEVVEQEVTRVVEVEKVVTATPEPMPVPAVGGTIVWALADEPQTLDPQLALLGLFPRYIGGAILALEPETGDYVPYLAESVNISDDGLLWEIRFKEGLIWHDGTPFSASDYAFTLERARQTASATAGTILQGFESAEAVDEQTVLIHMTTPSAAMQYAMTSASLQPLPKAYLERVGDEAFGRSPIGLGPYMFKEWIVGEKIVLERNPDFVWGPAYSDGEPPYAETMEFRFVPEYATQIAGLEAGEVDITYLDSRDVERLQGADQYQILGSQNGGVGPILVMNLERPPFDDLGVRKAFNMAVNREILVQVVALGLGEPQYGPVRPATVGYWPGVEYIGYEFDLEGAQALMAEAGYTQGDDGMLEKDGEPLTLRLKTYALFQKEAEIIQEQLANLGVAIDLQLLERGALTADLSSGEFDMTISSFGWADTTVMFPLFHSSMVGAFNYSRLADPELDPILLKIFMAPSREALEKASAEAQRYMVEQAYVVPLFTPIRHVALSSRLRNWFIAPGGILELFDTYVETTTK